jgi:Spy/CpxP family protein refolding chaperone
MNHFRLLVTEIMLMAALTASAQQIASRPVISDKDTQAQRRAQISVPTVEQHVKLLAERLTLTSDQQARIKPILQDLHDATQKFVQDESMSQEERLANVRASRNNADKKIREILNDEQKKKLDQLEQEPHPELHGNVNGGTSQPARPQI